MRRNLKYNMVFKIFVLLLLIFSVTLIVQKGDKEESILTNSQTLNNKKIGWGIKRNDNHEQPDLENKI